MVAYGNNIKPEDNSILPKVLENLWIIVASVIAFYFGGRAAETYADTKNSAANAQAKIKVLETEERTAKSRIEAAQIQEKAAIERAKAAQFEEKAAIAKAKAAQFEEKAAKAKIKLGMKTQ